MKKNVFTVFIVPIVTIDGFRINMKPKKKTSCRMRKRRKRINMKTKNKNSCRMRKRRKRINMKTKNNK